MIERGQPFKTRNPDAKSQPTAKLTVEPYSFKVWFRNGMAPVGPNGALKHVGWRVFSTAAITVQGVGMNKAPPHDVVVIGTTQHVGHMHVQLYPVYAPEEGSDA